MTVCLFMRVCVCVCVSYGCECGKVAAGTTTDHFCFGVDSYIWLMQRGVHFRCLGWRRWCWWWWGWWWWWFRLESTVNTAGKRRRETAAATLSQGRRRRQDGWMGGRRRMERREGKLLSSPGAGRICFLIRSGREHTVSHTHFVSWDGQTHAHTESALSPGR